MNQEAEGGGGGGADLDTYVPGSVSAVNDAADWLRRTFAGSCEDLATTVYRQRSRAESEWQGEAGEAFGKRAGTLAKGADGVAQQVRKMATTLDNLATEMSRAQSEMSHVRASAQAGGLAVSGHLVKNPGSAPSGADAAAMTAHNDKVTVWNKCCTDADSARERYEAAIEDAEKAAEVKRELVHFTGDFIESALDGTVKWGGDVQSSILKKQAEFLLGEEEKNLGHIDALMRPDGRAVFSKDQLAYLEDAAIKNRGDAAVASDRAEAAKGGSEDLAKTLKVIGLGATAYATWDEIHHGMNKPEAIVSNGTGFVAGAALGDIAGSAATGMVVGAVAGSEVPILGNAVGAVVGLVVGATVGAATTGAIQAAWEHGPEALGSGAWHGVKGLGESIGSGASWVWHHL